MTKEIRVEMKVRNNLILTRMEELGIKSVLELCRRMGSSSYPLVSAIVNLKVSPFRKNPENEADKWKSIVRKMAEALDVLDPEDLFPEALQMIQVPPSTKFFVEANAADLRRLAGSTESETLLLGEPVEPDKALEKKELLAAIERALESLTPREERVLRLRFGFEDGREWTLNEVGEEFGIVSTRVRQIEMKALRKLRHPARLRPVIKAGGQDVIHS